MSDEVLSQEEIQALIAQASENEVIADSAAHDTQLETDAAEQMPDPVVVDNSQPKVKMVHQQEQTVQRAEFSPLGVSAENTTRNGMELIMDVQLQVAVELGRARMLVRDVLSLGPGSVIELDKHAGEPVEVVVNNKTVARGEVVVIDENFGVRITEIVNAAERDSYAKAA
jgi:flagellar motor switch protein FliN/FliY